MSPACPWAGPRVSACVCVCVRVCGWPPFLSRARPDILPLPSQPLFKRFTQTHWAAPAQTLEAIILTVGERLPEFSELHDCFREVRRRGPAAQPGGKGQGQGQGQPAGACMLTGVRAHTPHACARDARLCLGACPSLDSRLRGSQAGGELPIGGWLTTCPLPLQELMELIHLHLVKEYIIRLSKRRVVLKTAEQQQQLAVHILANAALIQSFCTENVSPAPCPPPPASGPLASQPSQCQPEPLWAPGALQGRAASLQPGLCLQGSSAAWLHQALPTLAEIIRLQDPSAIKIEVATYATCYPDFR